MFGLVFVASIALAINAAVQPPSGTVLVASAQAGGVQIYDCARNPSGVWAWTLLEPVATLFDSSGKVFGAHSKGPAWLAADGSRVVADGKHPVGSVARPDSVPELLLNVTDMSGSGILSGVRYVQRVDTKGGAPPADGCDANHENARSAVHYSAIYQFYK